MTTLTAAQIRQYAYNAGFRGDALNTAVAVALAESGGNTAAYNPETAAGTANGSGSRGLWQIYGSAHPEYNNDNVLDPAKNAAAAYAVYKQAGNRFTPWSTFTGGAYQAYMSMVTGLGAVTGGTITTISTAAANSVKTISQAAAAVSVGGASVLLPPGLAAADNTLKAVNDKVNAPGFITDLSFMTAGIALSFIGLGLFFYVAVNSDAGRAAGNAVKVAAAL